MARTNRRIYSKRRKRSPNKFSLAALLGRGGVQQQRGPKNQEEQQSQMQGMQSDINQAMFNKGMGGAVRTAKYMVDNATPPYLGGKETGGSGVGGGKTYTITEA